MPFRNSPALDHATDRLTDDHQFNFIISISLHSLHTIIFLAPISMIRTYESSTWNYFTIYNGPLPVYAVQIYLSPKSLAVPALCDLTLLIALTLALEVWV